MSVNNPFKELDDFEGCYFKGKSDCEEKYRIRDVGYYIKSQLEKGRKVEDISLAELEPFKIKE